MKRPLLWTLAVLIAGIVMVYQEIPFWGLLFLPLLFLPFPFFAKSIKMSQMLFVLSIYFIGILCAFNTFDTEKQASMVQGKRTEILGVIDSVIPEDEGGRFTLKLKTINGVESGEKLEGTIAKGQIKLSAGDLVRFQGEITAPDGERNPGGFDYAMYLRSKGVNGQVYIKNTEEITVVGQISSLFYRVDQLNQKLTASCDTFFTKDESDLIKGVLLGSKDMSQDIKENFQNAGVSHVLAVSGLHVGYVYVLVLFILGQFKIKRKQRILFLLPCLLFYVALTGFSATVIRAALMLSALVLAEGLGEQYDTLNGVCLAAIMILLIEPAQLFVAGFQLSFGAVLGILLFYTPLLRLFEAEFFKPGAVISSLCLTLCATLGTLPASLYYFHSINLVSLVSNLLVVPVAGALVMVSLVTVPMMTAIPALGDIISLPAAFLADILLFLSGFFARFNVKIERGALSLLELGLFMLLVFLGTGYFNFRKKSARYFVSAALPLCILLMGMNFFMPKPLTITFLDVGQGDSALIETPGGGVYLIDGGGYEIYGNKESEVDHRKTISERVLLPALYAKNITHLDGVFITHNHADHSQGIEEILQVLPVDRIYVSTKYNNAALMKQNKIPVSVLSQGKKLTTEDGLSLSVFWPDEKIEVVEDDEQNEASMIVKIVYGARSVLFMADSGFPVEEAVGEIIGKSDVIKIGHHGSKYSSSEEFLEKIVPEAAVISVGKFNTFGHPTDEVLMNIEKIGARCYRTDESGAVVFTTNGKQMAIKPYAYKKEN